jgi:hypothetical protein
MRRRITKALVAAAAAGTTITTMGLAAAGSAGAATTAASVPHHFNAGPSGAPMRFTPPAIRSVGSSQPSIMAVAPGTRPPGGTSVTRRQ